MAWPGRIKPKSVVTDMLHATDMYATLLNSLRKEVEMVPAKYLKELVATKSDQTPIFWRYNPILDKEKPDGYQRPVR